MSELDMDYDKQIEFSVGSAGIMLAGMIVNLSDVEEPVDEILKNISRVQVGVYERNRYNKFHARYDVLVRLSAKLEEQGWKYIVRSVQDNEIAAVFVNEEDDEFSRLYVVAADDEQLVLVEIHGDLSKVIEVAVREKGFRMHMARN